MSDDRFTAIYTAAIRGQMQATPRGDVREICLKAYEIACESEKMLFARDVMAPEGYGWIPWGGGQMPVQSDTVVEYGIAASPQLVMNSLAKYLSWAPGLGSSTIVRYRIKKD